VTIREAPLVARQDDGIKSYISEKQLNIFSARAGKEFATRACRANHFALQSQNGCSAAAF
jgi:hypothetical protein